MPTWKQVEELLGYEVHDNNMFEPMEMPSGEAEMRGPYANLYPIKCRFNEERDVVAYMKPGRLGGKPVLFIDRFREIV